jgi:cell division protein FtsB
VTVTQGAQLGETDYWRMRARKYENELVAVNEELMFMNRKLLKLEELEDKIEVLLRQNTHLVEENEALLKVIQQKKSEADAWRLKFDSEYNATNALESEARKAYDNLSIQDQEHRFEVDKLTAEISRLHDQVAEQERLRQV